MVHKFNPWELKSLKKEKKIEKKDGDNLTRDAASEAGIPKN